MKWYYLALIISTFIIIAYFLVLIKETDNAKKATEKCIQACRIVSGNRSEGPCLSNNIIENWVCDIAHNPRIAADDLQENQCPAFGKTARHFVEVSEKCEIIKIH